MVAGQEIALELGLIFEVGKGKPLLTKLTCDPLKLLKEEVQVWTFLHDYIGPAWTIYDHISYL